MNTIEPYVIDFEDGNVGPCWSLDGAIEVAREAGSAGRKAVRIRRATEVVLEGAPLRRELDR